MIQNNRTQAATYGQTSVLATNSLIRNTYILLSLTLLLSAATAGIAMVTNAPMMNVWLVLGGYFGLLFLTNYLRNSAWGLLSVFALTGFMGYTLGPVLNAYIAHYGNGSQLVAYALGSTDADVAERITHSPMRPGSNSLRRIRFQQAGVRLHFLGVHGQFHIDFLTRVLATAGNREPASVKAECDYNDHEQSQQRAEFLHDEPPNSQVLWLTALPDMHFVQQHQNDENQQYQP